mgnify:CR=1 FL=1
MMKKFYVTTAIAYPNGRPHLGHALEIVQADVVARFHRLLDKDVWFQTGTDEHGIKNWETAKSAGKEIIEFLDENVGVFKDLYKQLNVSYDYFIRTSDKKTHYEGAKKLWRKLLEAGDIYKQNYKGLYCAGCESYKTEKELVDGKCPDHPTKEIRVFEEENYFFKLSKYKNQLIKLISSDEYQVIPEIRKNEILSFLKDVKDISFSRPKSSLPWGIPVPEDEDHVMYVWCDALSNYITGVGYESNVENFKATWPADVHIIGKDILRFHAAFWPAMLLSAGIELPKKLFVHGFILADGTKMGKSSGNAVEPFSQIGKYGSEAFKFYLIEAMPLESDGEYSEELLVERVNGELVSNLANFVYRTLSFLNKNFDGKIIPAKDDSLVKELFPLFEEVKSHYENYELRRAINTILKISSIGNKYFQDNEPWALIKVDKNKAHEILSFCVNLVKNLIILIKPVLPEFAEKIENQLNLKDLTWKDINFNLKDHTIGNAEIIYRKLEFVKEENESPFSKLNLKVAEILEVEDHPEADKLFVMQIDIGEKRQLVAGLRGHYEKEWLKGKKIVVVSNLESAKLRGKKSQGMLLAASNKKGEVGLLLAEKSKPGDQVMIDNLKPCDKIISYDKFLEVPLNAKDGQAYFEDEELKTSVETIIVDKKIKGKIK